MKPPGVIVNARAQRASRDRTLRERLERLVPAEYVYFTSSVDDAEAALVRLRERSLEQLLLVGGDGTVGGTLTPLMRVWEGVPLPALTLALGGTVNTIARSLQALAGAEITLRRMLDE